MAIRLRSGGFLDPVPDPKEVPEEVLAEIERHKALLRQKWDDMYPENPIESKEDDND